MAIAIRGGLEKVALEIQAEEFVAIVSARREWNRKGVARFDRTWVVAWLGFGLALALLSWDLGLGEAHSPGPGFFPFLTGCLLVVLSAIALVRSLLRAADRATGRGFWEGVSWRRPLSIATALIAYILLLPVLGYLLATLLFLVAVGWIGQPARWRTTLIVALLADASTYLLFAVWLKVQLPSGILGL